MASKWESVAEAGSELRSRLTGGCGTRQQVTLDVTYVKDAGGRGRGGRGLLVRSVCDRGRDTGELRPSTRQNSDHVRGGGRKGQGWEKKERQKR